MSTLLFNEINRLEEDVVSGGWLVGLSVLRFFLPPCLASDVLGRWTGLGKLTTWSWDLCYFWKGRNDSLGMLKKFESPPDSESCSW